MAPKTTGKTSEVIAPGTDPPPTADVPRLGRSNEQHHPPVDMASLVVRPTVPKRATILTVSTTTRLEGLALPVAAAASEEAIAATTAMASTVAEDRGGGQTGKEKEKD